jgi:hypothetical protein
MTIRTRTIPYDDGTVTIAGDAKATAEIVDIVNFWLSAKLCRWLGMSTASPATFSHAGQVPRAKCPRCRGEIVFEIAYKDGTRAYVCDICFFMTTLGAFKSQYREAERVAKTTTRLLERVKR